MLNHEAHTLPRELTAYSPEMLHLSAHIVLRISSDSPNSIPDHLELQMITWYQFLGAQVHE